MTITKEDLDRWAADAPQMPGDGTIKRLAAHALTLIAERDIARAANVANEEQIRLGFAATAEQAQKATDLARRLDESINAATELRTENVALDLGKRDLARRLAVVEGAARDFLKGYDRCMNDEDSGPLRALVVGPPAPSADPLNISAPEPQNTKPDVRVEPAPRVIAPGDVLRNVAETLDAVEAVIADDEIDLSDVDSPAKAKAAQLELVAHIRDQLLADGDGTPSRHPNPAPAPVASPARHTEECARKSDEHCSCGVVTRLPSGNTRSEPVASLAPAPDAGEAASQSVWCTYYVSPANGSVSVGMVELTKEAMEEDMRRCNSAAAGARLAGPYVLVQRNATDEERARELVHHLVSVLDAITIAGGEPTRTAVVGVIARAFGERDAAHRAEVAEVEARAYERAAKLCEDNWQLYGAAEQIRALGAK